MMQGANKMLLINESKPNINIRAKIVNHIKSMNLYMFVIRQDFR